MDLSKFGALDAASSVARATARFEELRASMRDSHLRATAATDQISAIAQLGSVHAQMIKDMKPWQSPAMRIAQQYKDLLGSNSVAMQAVSQLEKIQRAEQASVRKMIEPLASISDGLLLDSSTQSMIRDLAGTTSLVDQFRDVFGLGSKVGAAVDLFAERMSASRTQSEEVFESLALGSGIQSYLKDFDRINNQWKVPNEVLGLMGSLRELHDQLGKVALPTIDWGSAGAIANLLGGAGLEQQLAYLGIAGDGSFREPAGSPEKGILSRKQSDAATLLSLLLSILFFIYQENASRQGQETTEAYRVQTSAKLEIQSQQIQSLTGLIELALAAAAKSPEERFVVRGRTANVRSSPAHGSAVQGKLLPNEVVRAIDQDGKWIEVEYYHWLREEYRTGWVLKKYLDRVPASFDIVDVQSRIEN